MLHSCQKMGIFPTEIVPAAKYLRILALLSSCFFTNEVETFDF